MKPAEILLASAVIALVSGVGAALATRAFSGSPLRAEAAPLPAESAPAAPAESSVARELDELRLANATLLQRLNALEARLDETQSTRAPVALEQESSVARAVEPRAAEDRLDVAAGPELTPAFVDSVGQAMQKIKAREDAERDKKRKEQQAQRIEERVVRLQQELGLSN